MCVTAWEVRNPKDQSASKRRYECVWVDDNGSTNTSWFNEETLKRKFTKD